MQSKVEASADQEGRSIHPPINSLLDAMTFRLARLVAVNDRSGGVKFRDAFGLSLNEWRVIGLVQALSPAHFGGIRKILLMDKGQLSRVVKSLTNRGFMVTRPAADDARSVELLLTGDGRALHDNVLAFTAERNEEVVRTLSAEECTEFLRLLQKITAHTEELSDQVGLLE